MQMMDIQRILILLGLAVTSYMLILAWNEDYGQSSPVTEVPAPAIGGELSVPTLAEPQQASPSLGVPEGTVPSLDEPAGEIVIPSALVSAKTIQVITDLLELTIDLQGGDITKAALRQYPANIEAPDVAFVLIDPRNAYAAQSGLIGPDGTDTPGVRPSYTATSELFSMGDEEVLRIVLTPVIDSGALVQKIYSFTRGSYLADVSYSIQNTSDRTLKLGFYGQFRRDGNDPVMADNNAMGLQPFVGGATRSPEELYSKLEFDDIEETPYKQKLTGGYMAMVQHYFVSAWIPPQDASVTYQARKVGDLFLFGYNTGAIQVAPGETTSIGGSFYIGPKDQYRLQEMAEGLDLTVDYGFLWWLAQPLFYLMTLIHGFVNNWGVAIILLTVIVKTLLYPLSATSFRSMAKMRKLQPEMARLKERYGDDRQKFSQEMMELYKKEGANPLGGCLPILLQMPVFLALYWTLMESVELRQAPFALWIDDLSVMDPYFVLPILMGISMYLTQMLQPEPPDPVQAKVFKLMPIMFTFFFLWFPSGLVLYWLVNNILSIMQQYYVTRQIEKAG